MTATKNLTANSRLLAIPKTTAIDVTRRSAHFHRLFAPSHGVVVLSGYGIRVHVDRGHLIVEDGVGADRRKGRFPRVHHGLWRVVVIGADGMVSLAALRWLADQNVAFAMLERDGSVLLTTGPVAASDTRLRRAQACALHSDAAVEITRELISQKLHGQETVLRERLANPAAADAVTRFRAQLADANTLDAIRMLEGHGGGVYWSAWQKINVEFPKVDLARVPDHWRSFGNRRSPISGTSRKSANPVNAILNYLYTLLESETRLAITALGLDPGFGVLHVDQSTRDSLVYDLMEPVRPRVDAYVLDWITSTPLKRSWFFEQRDGTCRLMDSLATQLADTVQTWGREVAPLVEWFAQTLSATAANNGRVPAPGTRLTERRRYEGQGRSMPVQEEPPNQNSVCRNCGATISSGGQYCHACSLAESGKRLASAQVLGRVAAIRPESLKKRSDAMALHKEALRNWKPSDLPDYLTDEVYAHRIRPALARLSNKAIELALGVSKRYAYEIASGVKVPHRRHWVKLAELAGASAG